MTTEEIKTRYKLNFTNTVIEFEGSQPEILKQPYTFNESLTDFLSEWENPRILTSELLSKFERVLNEETESFDTNGQFVAIDSTISITKIYDENATINPVATLPTQDFYDILVLWCDFLLEPPLNGSIVKNSRTGIHKNWLGKVRSFFKRKKVIE